MKKSYIVLYFLAVLSALMHGCSSPENTGNVSVQTPDIERPNLAQPAIHPALSKESLQTGQHAYAYVASTGEEIPYLLYLPSSYGQQENWPVILFLHGEGAYGTSTDRVISQGGLPAFLEDDEHFEFIVISPQLPSGRWGKYIHSIDELMTHLGETLSMDSNRFYLTGLGIGAIGGYQYAFEIPDRFAAMALVAGGGNFDNDPELSKLCQTELALWVFHGDADLTQRPENIENIVNFLKDCDMEIQLTMYSGVDHYGTWPLAYAETALYEWFLEHTN
jgi:predicted peptidase